MTSEPLPPLWPFVGREPELQMIQELLDDAARGRCRALLLHGASGVGKTRLARIAIDNAVRQGWTLAVGSAYPVETGVPYALIADALVPVLRGLGEATLNLLTRGATAQLAQVFPALAHAPSGADVGAGGPELKGRVLWTVAELLVALGGRAPILLVLENLQWADPSSLEMLHFVLRQSATARLAVIATYNDTEFDAQHTMRRMVLSLVELGVATQRRLEPASVGEVEELLRRVFGDGAVPADVVSLLYDRTRGNPFFLEQLVKALIAAGRLQWRNVCWVGWDLDGLELPRTIRDALAIRVALLSPAARALADVAAVIGTRLTIEVLKIATGMSTGTVLAAVDELCRRNVLVGEQVGGRVVYDFTHPMVREMLYGDLGLGRRSLLHAQVASALERLHGASDVAHADELAYHFAQASHREPTSKAVRYLTLAGRSALEKHADREALRYLGAALEHRERSGAVAHTDSLPDLLSDLALAQHRAGHHDAALDLWNRARTQARSAGDAERTAVIERRMALMCYSLGRHDEGARHCDEGLRAAATLSDLSPRTSAIRAQLRIARGACLMELGRATDAIATLREALADAEANGDPGLAARAHRALLLASIITCDPDAAREHAGRTLELASAAGQPHVACTAHWALAVLAGLTGNTPALERSLAEARRIAEELRAPVLRLATSEVEIEYLEGRGDWPRALSVAEHSISLARALRHQTLLARLLVWTAVIYVGRGELDRARQYLDEAAAISGAVGPEAAVRDLNSALRVHMGFAAYHNARGEFDEAIRVSRIGLAIAERSGHAIWAIFRLWPALIEAHLWKREFDEAERLSGELRRAASVMDHVLGLAWAEAGEALARMLRGTTPALLERVIRATDALERVPFVFDAARLRREIARRHVELGDADAAVRVLEQACATFERLGAAAELSGAREQLRALGVSSRGPRRARARIGALTEREAEIARLIAARKTNKEIARALAIDHRTVGTHLHNIYGKLGIDGRAALIDHVRQGGLLEGATPSAPAARRDAHTRRAGAQPAPPPRRPRP